MILVEVDAEAEEEILRAAEWYEQRGRPGLGARFVDAVGGAIDEVSAQPESFAAVFTERGVVVRRHLVADFPYQIVFTLRTDAKLTVHILAVAHLRREPRYWLQRVP
jgi:plasmid stabilization system protein ParE